LNAVGWSPFLAWPGPISVLINLTFATPCVLQE
jgi:hypothetical protein